MNKKKMVVIGGGTGTFMVLSGLKQYPLHLSAIVSMADDGGSTGALRDQYGVLPPGDIRRALVALSESSKLLRDLFNYRFTKGGLRGHNFGNIFLTALEKLTGDFGEAVDEAATLLHIRGTVIPVTLDNIRLAARLTDGTTIRGEKNIDVPLKHDERVRGRNRSTMSSPKTLARAPIAKIWLTPKAKINPRARHAILEADMVVIGPGDLYTSLIPNLLVRGVPEALARTKAKKVYVANLMTKYGETHMFNAEQLLKELERYAGKNIIDFAIFNNKKPSRTLLRRYRKERMEFIDPRTLSRSRRKPKNILANLLDAGTLIRHNPKKLAEAIVSILYS